MYAIFEANLSAAFENYSEDVTSRKTCFYCTTYTIHQFFAVTCPVKVPFSFLSKVEMAQKQENKSPSELWCIYITPNVQFRKISYHSSVWITILCMHDREVTHECSFHSVVTVIGIMQICPFVHVSAHALKIKK